MFAQGAERVTIEGKAHAVVVRRESCGHATSYMSFTYPIIRICTDPPESSNRNSTSERSIRIGLIPLHVCRGVQQSALLHCTYHPKFYYAEIAMRKPLLFSDAIRRLCIKVCLTNLPGFFLSFFCLFS